MASTALVSNARPSPADKERIIDHVLAQLSEGRALYRILKEDPDLVVWSTWRIWVENSEELQAKVVRARETGVELHIDEAIDIADDSGGDAYIEYVNETPVARIDGEAIQRAKLRIETRFKRAAMIAPRKYGAKVDISTNGDKITNNTTVLVDARVQSLIHIALQRKQELKELGFDD